MIKLRPHRTKFIETSNPKAVLEQSLGQLLDLEKADEDELYNALDWLWAVLNSSFLLSFYCSLKNPLSPTTVRTR